MVKKKQTEFIVEYTTKDIMEKLEEIHDTGKATNGKVEFHTKLIWGSFGGLVILAGWLFQHIITG